MESYHNLTLPSNGSAQLEITTAVTDRALRHTSGNVRTSSLECYGIDETKSTQSSQAKTYVKLGTSTRHKLAKPGSQPTQKTKPTVNVYLAHVSKARRCTPAFLEYRKKQRRPNRKTGEPVWPDDLEEAFHEALDIIGPRGRKKTMYRGKSMGGNELISEYIKDRTGQFRGRKQVSSHIQVLKKFNIDNPEFMDKVKPKDSASNNATVKPYSSNDSHRSFGSNEPKLAYKSTTESTYEGRLPSFAGLSTHYEVDLDLSATSSTRSRVLGLDFKMWVEPRQALSMAQPPRHVYTETSHRNRYSQATLDSVGDWRSKYPKLASLEQRRDLDCEIILLETSLDFVSDYPPQNSTLGVQFQLDLSNRYMFNDWACETNIYTGGGHHCAVSQSSPIRQLTNQDAISLEGEYGPITIAPPFHSAFWSELFTDLMHKRACHDQNGDSDSLKRQAAATRKCIRGISAMQELYAVPSDSSTTPQRVAIFLWKFRQADPAEPGITTWRNLIPPPSQILTNSSLGPELHHSIDLKETLHESEIECVDYSYDHSQLDMLDDPSTTAPETPTLIEGMEYAASSFPSTQAHGQVDTDFTGGHISLHLEPAPLDTYDEDTPCFSQPTDSLPHYELSHHDHNLQNEDTPNDSNPQYEHPPLDTISQYEHDSVPHYEPSRLERNLHYEHSSHDSVPYYEPSQPESNQHYEHSSHDSVPHYDHPEQDRNLHYEHSQLDSVPQYEHPEQDGNIHYENPEQDTVPQYEPPQQDSIPEYEYSQPNDDLQYEHSQQDSIQQYEQYEHTSWLNYGSLFAGPNHQMPEPVVDSIVVELA